jgi:hypothetical protein
MVAFLRRLSLHYGIYRRYPLRPLSALQAECPLLSEKLTYRGVGTDVPF